MNIASENEKLKVAAYCRVSTKLESQKSSIEAQINYYTRLIEENLKWENAGVYIDYGSRCRIKGRPEFSKMIENALSGEIDLIITKSISRFSGNTVDMLVVIRELKEKGIEVYFEKEQISSLDAKAEQIITIYTAIAQEEVQNMSENIKWGYEQKFARGEVMHNYKNFYGYYVVNLAELNNEEGEDVQNPTSVTITLAQECIAYRDYKKYTDEASKKETTITLSGGQGAFIVVEE